MKSHRTVASSYGGVQVPAAPESRTGEREADSYAFGPFRLLPGERILRRGTDVLALPPKAFETLLLLVRNAGHLLRKEDLLAALWPDSFVEEVSLASKISLLRKVLGETHGAAAYIQTVSKQGYRFIGPVTRTWAKAPATGAPNRPGETERSAIRFIALPFRIVNGDAGIAFLSQSLPEAVSASLAGLRSFTVRSSLLAASLMEGQPDPRRIAQEAEVDMLLSGSIFCDQGQLRVSAELTHAPSGTVVGSFVCQSGRDNLIEIPDRLVRGIVDMLVLRLTEREQRVLSHNVPASARAYEFFLRANSVQRQRTFENLSMARDLYRECLDEDPDYAPAWARLGRCYRFLEKFGQEGAESLEQAKWAFHRSFALSPDLPITHNLYTSLEADSGHAQEAMVRLAGLWERHPNDPELFSGLVQACRYCGLLEESVGAHRQARRLDSRIVTSVAHTYFLMGDYQNALEQYPPGSRYYLDLAILAAMGKQAEALALLGRRTFPAGQFAAMIEALRFSLQGEPARAMKIARHGLALSPPPDPETKFYLTRQLAHDGAPEESLRNIQSLLHDGFFSSHAMRHDPWMQPIRSLPGFQSTLAEVEDREATARAAFRAACGDRVFG